MEGQNYPQLDFVEKYSFFALDIPAQWHKPLNPFGLWIMVIHGHLQEEREV